MIIFNNKIKNVNLLYQVFLCYLWGLKIVQWFSMDNSFFSNSVLIFTTRKTWVLNMKSETFLLHLKKLYMYLSPSTSLCLTLKTLSSISYKYKKTQLQNHWLNIQCMYILLASCDVFFSLSEAEEMSTKIKPQSTFPFFYQWSP